MAQTIEVPLESPKWEGHLYIDEAGRFGWSARDWERAVLQEEQKRKGYAGFFRNVPRKEWSVCIPYGAEEDQAMYPDILIFRRLSRRVVVDMLEPHGTQFGDHLAKAKGLANYARKHGSKFGRIEMISLVDSGGVQQMLRLNMQDSKVCSKVLNTNSSEQLIELYSELG